VYADKYGHHVSPVEGAISTNERRPELERKTAR
jgi:hypothetical protein